MRCTEFLELYSDYRDGLIADAGLAQRLDLHIVECSRCRRYHQLLTRATAALGSVDDISPSPQFRSRLRHRLAELASLGEPVMRPPARVAVALIMAAALGTFLFEHASRSPKPESIRVASAHPPMPMVVANAGYPFVMFADLRAPTFEVQPGFASEETSLTKWVALSR